MKKIKMLKTLYFILTIMAILGFLGTKYLESWTSWYVGYDISKVDLPFTYYFNYGMYPIEYYYLKTLRVIIYLIWGLSLYFIIYKIKIKLWMINITYPIFIFQTCLIFLHKLLLAIEHSFMQASNKVFLEEVY